MHTTAKRLFTRGIVIEDKDPTSNKVKVWPYELLPVLDGVITTELAEWKNDGIDHDAIKWEEILKTGHWIECEWIYPDTNRVTPPDLKRREKVDIYRVADSHKYYWDVDGREDHLRRLEHVVHAYSDIPPEIKEDIALTGDNCYTHVVSTRDGKIHWRTSKENGEEFLFDLLIDTANSYATLTDDTMNRYSIDSKEKIVRMENADGTFIELNKENINGYAPDSWNMTAENDITFTCTAFTMTAKDSVSIETKDFSCTASTSFQVDSPTSTFTGNVSIAKNLTVTGNASMASGAVSFVPGSATFTVPLTAAKVTSTAPISAPNV